MEAQRMPARVVATLPHYPCNLNPIELVRSQLMTGVAIRNVTFTLQDVRQQEVAGLGYVTAERRQDTNQHVIQEGRRILELLALLTKQGTCLSQTLDVMKFSATCLIQTRPRRKKILSDVFD